MQTPKDPFQKLWQPLLHTRAAFLSDHTPRGGQQPRVSNSCPAAAANLWGLGSASPFSTVSPTLSVLVPRPPPTPKPPAPAAAAVVTSCRRCPSPFRDSIPLSPGEQGLPEGESGLRRPSKTPAAGRNVGPLSSAAAERPTKRYRRYYRSSRSPITPLPLPLRVSHRNLPGRNDFRRAKRSAPNLFWPRLRDTRPGRNTPPVNHHADSSASGSTT